ncbi:MAG TPA: response regulator [Methanoculleus sp.]|nr:response regulator [Methanoculleus sp.]
MIQLLIVDDEPLFLPLTKTFLEQDNADIECDTCESAQEALEKLAGSPYDCIVSDYDMPGMDGIALLKAVRTQYSDFPFILLTGRGREEVVIEALNEGADFYLQKSAEPRALYAELASKVRHAVDRRRAREALMRTQFSIDHLSAEFYWIDPEGYLIDVNESACHKLGYTRDELFAMRVPDVDPDVALEGFEEAWQTVKEHQTLCIESHHRKRDGTVYPVELSPPTARWVRRSSCAPLPPTSPGASRPTRHCGGARAAIGPWWRPSTMWSTRTRWTGALRTSLPMCRPISGIGRRR